LVQLAHGFLADYDRAFARAIKVGYKREYSGE
jgi:hypothetical protein